MAAPARYWGLDKMPMLDPSMFNQQGVPGWLMELLANQGGGAGPGPGGFPPQESPAAMQANAAAPMPQSAAPPPQQQGPGILGMLGNGIAQNPLTLMALGAGISQGGFGKGLEMAVPAAMADQKTKLTSQNQNLTYNALIKKGVDPETARAAVSNPTLLQSLLTQMAPKSGVNINGRLVNPVTGKQIADYSDTKAPETKEFETSGGGKVARQYNPVTRAWEEIPGIGSGGAPKPPAGFSWNDPNDQTKGLSAIPGGPATHIPAEVAGRIAMMDTAAKELPNAKKVLLGEREGFLYGRSWYGAGPGASVESKFEFGDVGRAKRAVRVAIEGALRAMTGAAAPETEVQRYEDLFLPVPNDNPQTAAQKLQLLDDFMSAAKKTVTQGRSAAPPLGADPLGLR